MNINCRVHVLINLLEYFHSDAMVESIVGKNGEFEIYIHQDDKSYKLGEEFPKPVKKDYV